MSRFAILTGAWLLLFITGCPRASGSVQPKILQTRIVGGQMDATEKATYQISLQALVHRPSNTTKHYHFCSGAILTRRHVVTAAHCLTGWQPQQLSVVAGTKVWNRADGLRHAVAGFDIHERYEKLNGHDIGMLRLTEPLQFSDRITAIRIDDHFVPAGVPVVLTGWGYTLPIRDPGFLPQWVHAYLKSYPKELQITRLKTITNAECRESYDTMRLETELCTFKWGTGACSGDSGGPLVNVDRNRLLGIVSFGFVYCGGYTGYPDGFTRVSNFTQWINERITV